MPDTQEVSHAAAAASAAEREDAIKTEQKMAVLLHIAGKLVPAPMVAVILKSCWHTVPYFVDGVLPNYYAFVLPVMVLAGVVTFFSARMKGNLYLGNLKVASVIFAVTLLAHVVTLYKYHALDPKYAQYPKRLFRHLKESGTIQDKIWLDRFATFEAGLDILQALALLAVATPLHSFVMESVRIEKALKQKELLESLKLRRPTSKPRAKRL